MVFVVGLVGKIASGKGVVSDYLVNNYGARVYRFSDVLRDVLLRLNKPVTRENLQSLGFHLRQVFGENVLAEVVKGDIIRDGHGFVVVDGIRYWDEFKMVRVFEKNLVVSITAPLEVRYQRVVSRATRGEEKISIEEFKKSEANPTEMLIDEIAAHADIKIENLGSKDALLETLDIVLKGRLDRGS